MMRVFWSVSYNLLIYPFIYIVVFIGRYFNQKLKEGFDGRRQSIRELKTFFKDNGKRLPVYWFHAASHGEYEQVKPVLAGMKEIEPNCIAVVSFFSPSGYNHVVDENIDCKIYLPFDFIWSVRRALKIARPKKFIFAAYDIWPNLIWVASHRHIHINIFAARFIPGTRKLYPVIRSFYRTVYRAFSTIYTITKEDYLSLQSLLQPNGNPVIRVLGNPRYDQVKKRADQFTEKRTISVLLRDKRIIAGSVWHEDESIILEPLIRLLTAHDDIRLIWVPHEPTKEYVDHSQKLFEDAGLSTYIMKSKKDLSMNGARVGIVGIVGILYKLYWQGQVAYLGGGFSTGVHNVMEPAIARLPVVFGPRYTHFQEAVDLVNSGGGFAIETSEDAYRRFEDLLTDRNQFLDASLSATDVIHNNLGSSTRIVRGLLRD